jgi:hemerythrin-like domain-containing protein
MMDFDSKQLHRRGVLALTAALGTGIVAIRSATAVGPAATAEPEAKGDDEDLSAEEGLMREHGVLRRTLNVYAELAVRLQWSSGNIDFAAFADAAKLFREFCEDYHERKLEEAYIFPELRKAGGQNEKLVEVLLAQHQRGREITDYIHRTASQGKTAGHARRLARALSSFVQMYNAHFAWEDTVIFPAWKATQPKMKLAELADKFDDIQREIFGEDGFKHAVARIGHIEEVLGMGDLAQFTAPPPPAS